MTKEDTRVLQGLMQAVQAIATELQAVKSDAAYARQYMKTMGEQQGTMDAVIVRLNSIHQAVQGRRGIEVREERKREDLGLMELGRMPLPDAMEFLKKYNAEKANGSINYGPHSVPSPQQTVENGPPQSGSSGDSSEVHDIKRNNRAKHR